MFMEIRDIERQETLMVRTTTTAESLPRIMGEIFQEIGSYIIKKEIGFAGPPYAMYYNMDMEALDVEMGFPVLKKDNGEGRIKAGELPAGRVATTLHSGPYEKLEDSYNRLLDFIKEKGLAINERMYECYLNSPLEVKPEELQTQIFFILK